MTTPYYNAGSRGPVIVQGQPVSRPGGSYMPFSSNHGSSSSTKPHHLAPANVYNHGTTTNQDMKPAVETRRPCRDVIWGILFYAHFGAIAFLGVMYAPTVIADVAASSENNNGNRLLRYVRALQDEGGQDADANDGTTTTEIDIDPAALLVVLGLSGVLSLVISSLAMGFMMAFAEALVKIALLFNIFLFGGLGVMSVLGGAVGLGVIFFILSGVSTCYAWGVWSRIPFAASNLVTAVTAVKANMGLAFYAYTSLVMLFLWSVCWSVSTISTIYVLGGCNAQGECATDVNIGIIFVFLVSYYWTIQVISNVVHVTTSGTVGTWWMVPNEANGCCSSAVRDSYVRSITTSFGSICLGSLLVAIIQAVKEMIHSARENGDSFVACCAECLIGCLESLMEYFNKWAFVYVGLYGFSFMEAGVNVMTLFRNRGWTTIITDYMVDTVLFMVSMGVGFLTAILATAIGAAMQLGDSASLGMAFVIGFIVGYGMCTTLFSLVSSAVNTVIVCYAEAPNEFQANHPQLSEKMRSAWRQAWPDEFHY